eukprot:TRINITY_DN25759_c0_g1_i2.p1 TRINITY_DN25759_c0_g1~~TRINITY_DN25759_c0_g1_i2.p1  ORF type:complete len:286 (-),score=15.54 TRINITY_DN25759_c0_g1_i2:214-1032(-)
MYTFTAKKLNYGLIKKDTSQQIGRQILSKSQQDNAGTISREVLDKVQRLKLDMSDDRQFYDFPRLVKHVDDQFLDKVTELYRQRIPPGGAVLDLMSSWVSHLPPEIEYEKVIGHGMNAAELMRNPRLDSFFVRNLNKEPNGWSVPDQSFDAVLCCVSVQYLQQPEKVFAEIFRVLKPGGVLIITFSNRLFYTKAISAWRDASGFARCQLVKQYISCINGYTEPEVLTEVSGVQPPKDPLVKFVRAVSNFISRSTGDPFYAVITYRNFKKVLE